MPTDHSSQPFPTVLARELGHMQARRRAIFPKRAAVANEDADAHAAKPLGLAFSGGGIRSATFNLGVLQGLAELGLLKYVDYLSTVSGGGYIGSWLHGVISNSTRCQGDPAKAEHLLSPLDNPTPGPPQHDPISFLRKFSNYLAPRPGLFTADTWVIALIWLRNVALNQLILIPSLSVAILVALLLVFVQQLPAGLQWRPFNPDLNLPAAALALAALAFATIIIMKNLAPVVRQTFTPRGEMEKTDAERAWERRSLWTVPCIFVASVLLGCAEVGQTNPLTGRLVFIMLVGLFALFQVWGGFVQCYTRLHPGPTALAQAIAQIAWMVVVVAAVSAGLVVVVWRVSDAWTPWNRIAFAPPLVCLSLLTGSSLLVGLMGSDYPDAAREWIARVASMLALTCAGWAAFFVLSVHAPKWFAWLLGNYGKVGFTAVVGWLLTTIGGVLAGRSPRSSGKETAEGGGALEWLAGAAPTVFMIGYLMLLSLGAHAALVTISPPVSPPQSPAPQEPPKRVTVDVRVPETAPAIQVEVRGPEGQGWLARRLEPIALFAARYYDVFSFESGRVLRLILLLIGSIGVAVVASRRINVNEFSMHHFYKNRLVRAYLGASNSDQREPNALTGFDPADDFRLSSLVPNDTGGYRGPYSIVNVALNLNAGSELAQQERKAASFVFTPQFCGFAPSHSEDDAYEVRQTTGLDQNGYRPTKGYSHPSGPDVGIAMAISGAAANPNMGYHTSGPMAFLLTVFDARLGWWLGNPRWQEASTRPGPSFALWYLLSELLGQTTARSKFVNLSDGGHFENLGLYELVRRRCRYIIIGDAEQDGGLTFGGLGGAIRKCRADFGVEIDINPDPIRLAGGFSQAHCVVGTITYPENDTGDPVSIVGEPATPTPGKARGWILYLKASLTGDEPTDVIEYRSQYTDFPHQSTGDQFFSESQFESYRRLGLHIVRDAFEGVQLKLTTGDPTELVRAFQALTRKWYAPPPVAATDASRLNDAYSGLMRMLGEKQDLVDLVPELVADSGASGRRRPVALNKTSEMFLVEAIQLMENVYTEFRLGLHANRANPRNAGWMKVFRRWMGSSVFVEVWEKVQDDYNPLFQQFMEELRERAVEDVPMRS